MVRKSDEKLDITYSDLIKKMVNWMSPGTFDTLFIDTSLISILKNCQQMLKLLQNSSSDTINVWKQPSKNA